MITKLSFDDGAADDIRLAELLDKHKFDAIFYLPSRWGSVNNWGRRQPLSHSQAKDIARRFEIGSHGTNHALLTRIPEDLARDEIFTSKRELEEFFGKPVTKFCYARGYANPEIQQMVKEAGYESARSTVVGYLHESENPYFEQTTVHVGYDRKEYAGLSWFEYAMKMLNEAVKTPDSVYHLWGHSWEISEYDGWYDLDILLKEVRNVRHE